MIVIILYIIGALNFYAFYVLMECEGIFDDKPSVSYIGVCVILWPIVTLVVYIGSVYKWWKYYRKEKMND